MFSLVVVIFHVKHVLIVNFVDKILVQKEQHFPLFFLDTNLRQRRPCLNDIHMNLKKRYELQIHVICFEFSRFFDTEN